MPVLLDDALRLSTENETASTERLATLSSTFSLGVCVLPDPLPNRPRTTAYPHYIHEILTHAGVCYASIAVDELPERLKELQVLVTVGEAECPPEVQKQLRAWIEAGGSWLSVSGVCGLAELFGAELIAPAFKGFGAGAMSTLGEGYLQVQDASHPALGHLKAPLHFFNGISVRSAQAAATALDKHGRPTERAVLVENSVGQGRCLLIAADVTGTVVRVQQGVAITRDGVSSADGLGTCGDGVLKSDDGMVLDWILDREPVPGVPGFEAFLRPVADQWREVVLRAIFHLAAQAGVSLPLLWFYPRNLPALGHVSHDTDGNHPGHAHLLLEAMAKAEVSSTWCTICPGYERALIDEIRDAGHELAMHYDTITPGLHFSEAEFERQWRELAELFGEHPVTNKNHYLRWEGDTEFFKWCQKCGIEMDQSKGASKTGEAGFNFGTCHPYFPIAPDGTFLDVLELPTPTQDLYVFAPPELLPPLLQKAWEHYGVLHLLFHPSHIEKPGVADIIVEAARLGRERGMEWWTARQLNEWERARRKTRWAGVSSSAGQAGAESVAVLRVEAPLPDATLLWLQPQGGTTGATEAKVNGTLYPVQRIERWGFAWNTVVVDAVHPGDYQVEMSV